MLGRPAFMRMGRAIVVGPAGEPRGLLSITDVERVVRASPLASEPNGTGPARRPAGMTKR
jgi:hypothetical protein